MNGAPSQSLINLLLESGVPSTEEAAELTTNLNGGSWVSQVLDSGKVDEQRFLTAIGNFFRVPVVSIDAKNIDRPTLSNPCRAAVEKTCRMGARAARAASARDENSLWRWRGDLRRDSEDQGFHGRAGGHRDRD